MKKLLITGASGFLGRHLCEAAKGQWLTAGTYLSRSIQPDVSTAYETDLREFSDTQQMLIEFAPHAVIHTAAESNSNYCQLHPDESRKLNVGATIFLAMHCSQRNIPFVFCSTDLVFDGQNAPYSEDNKTNPLNDYGKQKAEAENWLKNNFPKAIICRLPLILGYSKDNEGKGFIPSYAEALRNNTTLTLFKDEFRTPASATSIAEGMLNLIRAKAKGTYHLGGRESISRYELGIITARIFGLEAAPIKAMLQSDMYTPAPRPSNVSLNSEKAYEAGFNPLSIDEELVLIRKKMENEV